MSKKPRIAIVGASGFVGATLVERLYFDEAWRDRFEFVAFIRGFGNAARLTRLPVKIESLDLLDYPRVRSALAGFDAVINCTRGDAALMLKGLRHLTKSVEENRVPRFIHLSSVAIYGEDPPAESAREDAPLNPRRSPYGDIKAAQDEMVFDLHRRGVPSIILCPSNIGGPYSGLIVDAVAKLAAGEIVLVDEGRYPTNIVHVDNLVEAMLVAVQSDTGWGERYFVNEQEPVTWKEFFGDLAGMLGIEADFPLISREEVLRHMEAGSKTQRPGLKSQAGALLSTEFREGISVVPAFKSLNDSAKGVLNSLSPSWQERIRRRIARPIIIRPVRETRSLEHKLTTVQVRRVYHSPAKLVNQLGYKHLLDRSRGMETTRRWLEFANLIPAGSHPVVEPHVK
ncbi:MAG TPA: NAD-dependent epimerase/dehydratase family protein [Candidatus Krumholzibacteria bacterium]